MNLKLLAWMRGLSFTPRNSDYAGVLNVIRLIWLWEVKRYRRRRNIQFQDVGSALPAIPQGGRGGFSVALSTRGISPGHSKVSSIHYFSRGVGCSLAISGRSWKREIFMCNAFVIYCPLNSNLTTDVPSRGWRTGERFIPAPFSVRRNYESGGVMVWAVISMEGLTNMIFIDGSQTAAWFIEDMLSQEAVSYMPLVGGDVIFMYENTRPHTTRFGDFLEQTSTQCL